MHGDKRQCHSTTTTCFAVKKKLKESLIDVAFGLHKNIAAG